MKRSHGLRSPGACHRADNGLGEGAIEAEIDFRYARHRREPSLILRAVDPESADVVERARLQPEQVFALDQIAVFNVIRGLGDDRFVESGRRDVDHLHAGDEFAVLLRRDLAGYEDAKMPDRLMQRVDDRLAVRDDLVDVVIEVEDPVERLLRRRDVVAPGAEAQRSAT